MSLQRIFESARKLGFPVIITDPAGREPMVVLPLEQFEAMAGSGETRELEPLSEPQSAQPLEQPHSERIPTVSSVPEVEPIVSPQMTHFSSEILLEEGFYLDPSDDQVAI